MTQHIEIINNENGKRLLAPIDQIVLEEATTSERCWVTVLAEPLGSEHGRYHAREGYDSLKARINACQNGSRRDYWQEPTL